MNLPDLRVQGVLLELVSLLLLLVDLVVVVSAAAVPRKRRSPSGASGATLGLSLEGVPLVVGFTPSAVGGAGTDHL